MSEEVYLGLYHDTIINAFVLFLDTALGCSRSDDTLGVQVSLPCHEGMNALRRGCIHLGIHLYIYGHDGRVSLSVVTLFAFAHRCQPRAHIPVTRSAPKGGALFGRSGHHPTTCRRPGVAFRILVMKPLGTWRDSPATRGQTRGH